MKLFEIKNTPPKWQLLESAGEQATHLEHLEDEIFNKGYVGALEAFNYINSVRSMLDKGEGNPGQVTVKWDGAPAIHCGIDPTDSQFFVGTKSVFAKTEPKLCKTNKQIDAWYPDSDLGRKLKLCLKYLPKLGIGGVIKGDLLFTEGDFETIEIDGQQLLAVTPNTITYTTPVGSELAKRWQRAKLGIVFHTVYDWNPPSEEAAAAGAKNFANVPDMVAKFGFSASGLNQTPAVWFDDAFYNDYTGIASLTPQENQVIIKGLNQVAQTLTKIDPKTFDKFLGYGNASTGEFNRFIKPFINSMVRAGKSQMGEPTMFLKQFIDYVHEQMQKEIDKLKGGPDSPAAQERIKKILATEKFIADNSNTLLGILAIYKKAVELKLLLLSKLQQIEGITGTFMKTETGYKVSKPEGFVAVGHDGSAVKFVDRIDFSRENFLAAKKWQNPQTNTP